MNGVNLSNYTNAQADNAYGTTNWQTLKIDIYNNFTNVLLYSFSLGTNTNSCIVAPQTYSSGFLNASWAMDGPDVIVTISGS